MALEVNDSRQIIIKPIIITDIQEEIWHKSVDAPYTYSITGSIPERWNWIKTYL